MLIDYGSRPPIPGIMKTGQHLTNYRRVYAASEEAVPAHDMSPAALDAYLAMYDRLGARHVVIKARDVETTFGLKVANEDVATFCQAHSPRFIGFAGVDPNKGIAALRELCATLPPEFDAPSLKQANDLLAGMQT